MIIHNATIHSPVHRFATALHIEEGIIVWLGDEDTASYRSRAHPEVEVVDAGGNLLTPSFHNTYAEADSAFAAQGITAAHVRLHADGDLGRLAEHLDVTGIHTDAPRRGPAIHLLPGGASAEEMEEFLHPPHPPGVLPALTIATRAELEEFLRASPRVKGMIYLDAALAPAAQALVGWSVVVVLDGDLNLPLADLTRAGVPFAVGGPHPPWEAITRMLFEGPAPISARAGFTALTRGAWRLTPGQLEPRGVLRVGAPADLALWEVEALAVQAPDEAAAVWSTDQRAGTPLLPALGEGEGEPMLTAAFRGGEQA